MSRPDKKKIILAILGLGILSVFVYLKDPLNGPILPCIFNQVTGLYCPGCGMTRAVHWAFHLRFDEALRFNALIFIIPILMIFYYVATYKEKPQIAKIVLLLMLIISIAYGILRNISPFDFLAPGS